MSEDSALRIIQMAGECRMRQEAANLQWDEHGITNDAPRRRTEPAITVPPAGLVSPIALLLTELDSMKWEHPPCHHEHVTDGLCEDCGQRSLQSQYDRMKDGMTLGGAWSFNEAYDAKAHGAAAYADLAATMEQVRMLAHAAWVRSLPVWQPDETCGDYARRAGILPPKPGKREQWEDSVWLAAAERMALEMSDE